MDADTEDFVFYGTPIEREEDLTSRKKKSVAEAAGQLRSLPHWKQEVRDEDGRRRLHGAFTGGFSAGYFNTVGSKEGWTPQTFTSSRKNRAEVKQQDILNFLDEDEKEELEGRSLGTSSQFDTFGFTAAEVVRKQVEKEQQQRPSAIPGPVPDELVLPAAESIGVKLLLKMGWRRGHSIKESRANVQYNARREARRAFLAFSSDDATKLANSEAGMDTLGSFSEEPLNDNVQSSIKTPVYVLNPKQDVYGLGYDPYKHAPEFREIKRSRISGNRGGSRDRKALSMKESLFGSKSGKAAPGFGIGALEEYDAEDEDIYAHAYDFEETHVQDDEEYPRSTTDHMQKLAWKEHHEGLRGFRVASNFDYQLERFDPPSIPKDFVPQHKFQGPPEVENKFAIPPPPEVPPPTDSNLKVLIEGVATLVARCGKLFEDLSRQKNQSNPLFSFLNGGNGQEYYVRKLWEEQQKHNGQKKLALDGKSSPSAQKMTAETRGKILGERPLERTSKEVSSPVASGYVNLNLHLSDAFTMPASFNELPEVAKPFKNNPVKQERFERFLKEKYQGGLRSTEAGGSSNMSEAARARERLDFEAAAEAIEKGKWNKETSLFTPQTLEFAGAGGMLFTSGGQEAKDVHAEDLMTKKTYPKREEFQWRPSPILCKRFDLIDPYMGKPPPPPRVRSRIDSLTFTSDSKASKVKETVMVNTVLQSGVPEITKDVLNEEPEVEVQVEKVERPVDLYKAIFSDDSDDEVEVSSSVKKGEDPDKKIEVAHTALNRLIAGDFLESLGKELGLEVPPDMPYPNSKARSSGPQKETEGSADKNGTNILSVESKAYNTPNGHSMSAAVYHQEVSGGVEAQKNDSVLGNTIGGSSKRKEHGPSDYKSGKLDLGLMVQEDGKSKSAPSRQRKRSYSSSSEDDRSRKHSKPHRYRSSDSGSDSSSDYRDRHRSKSKGRKKRSSQEKRSSSSSRKHSKHGKYESRESPSRSHYSAVEERVARKEKHRRRRD